MVDHSLIKSFLQSTAGEWVMILSLVFGGCCSNVWALEAVLRNHPNSGTFLTFAQFAYVTFQNISSQFYLPPPEKPIVASKDSAQSPIWKRLRLPKMRKRAVPMKRWLVQVVLFLGVSLMNNYAFGLKIPVTVHIIFRSGGLCVSMLTGYFLAGKRYSVGQVFSGVIITFGIILATLSAPRRRSPASPASPIHTASTPTEYLSDNFQYAAGIAILSLALFLSAWLGLWQERTYKLYGRQWREALFYCHFLSLPFFIPLYPSLQATYTSFAQSQPITLLKFPQPSSQGFISLYTEPIGTIRGGGKVGDALDTLIQWKDIVVPSALFALAVNVVTQGLCIRGVNRLTSRVNSTTVNLVLTVRKAVSLAISVWFYGSGLSLGLVVGGGMVLAGTVIYSMAPGPKVITDDVRKKTDDLVPTSMEGKEEKRFEDRNGDAGLRLRTGATSGSSGERAMS